MVTINGSGFVSDGGVTSVMIGGVPAGEIIPGTDILMWARVGAGAQNGSLVVTTKAGSATAAVPVVVYPCQSTGAAGIKPTIGSVSPVNAKPGKKLTLLGSGFVGTKSVTVGGENANYAIPSDGVMYIRLPSDETAGSKTILVTNNLGTAKSYVIVGG